LDGWLGKGAMVYILALPILLSYLLPSDFPLMGMNGGWRYFTYLFFLLWGFMLVADECLQESIHRLRWVSLSVGLVLVAGFVIVYSQIANPEVMSPSLFLAGMMRVFGGWISILGFLGLAAQYLTASSPKLNYANEAVLPFYIFHQTILLVVGYFVLQWGIPDVLEWAVIVVISFVIIMALYEFVVRHFNVVRFLFGMKVLSRTSVVRAVDAKVTKAA